MRLSLFILLDWIAKPCRILKFGDIDFSTASKSTTSILFSKENVDTDPSIFQLKVYKSMNYSL